MSIPTYDAWVLRRLLCGRPVTREDLDAMPEPWKGMGERLDAPPPGERSAAWEAMLADRPDRDEIIMALANADPDGPPPDPVDEAIVEAADGWGPLRISDPPDAEPFPVDVFPPPVATFAREVAESVLCPVDFVGTAMLAVAGTAIGQSVSIEVKRGWYEAPLLYAVIVAEPGKAKTPAIRAATKPLVETDTALREKSKLAREQWQARKEAYDKGETDIPPGPEPPRLRAIVKDITRESLCLMLADNPRGVLCSPDEATAWVGSWNQYKSKGTDEQFWLSLYSGDPVSVDRKGGRESTLVPHPYCGLIGGIQPDLLADLRDDRGCDNGMTDRIVFSYPSTFPIRRWTDRHLSPEAEQDWSDIIHRLASVDMRVSDDDDAPKPWLAKLTPEARTRFIEWFDANGREMEEPGSRTGALSKGEARLARLALILSRLRLACDPERVLYSGDGVPPVEQCDIEGAIRLTAYFADHLNRAAHRMSRGVGDPDAQALLDWIKRHRHASFREAEAAADLRGFRTDPDTLQSAIASLTSLGAIRPKAEPAIQGKRGPKPSPSHDVHPELLKAPGITSNPVNCPIRGPREANCGINGNSRRY